jgi:hypothetical protein
VGVKNFFKKISAPEEIPPHADIEEESNSYKGGNEGGAAVTEQRQGNAQVKPHFVKNFIIKAELMIGRRLMR